MIKAAQKKFMDIAEVRHGIHDTTRVRGKTVPDRPHITGNVKDSKSKDGFSLHYYVDRNRLVELPSTPDFPNPVYWKL